MNIKTHFQKDWIYYLALGMALVAVAIDLRNQSMVPMLAAVLVFAVVLGYLNVIKPNKIAAAFGFWIVAVYVALALMEMIPASKENIFSSVISFAPAYLGAYGGWWIKSKVKKEEKV
jgi:hypothetical protein